MTEAQARGALAGDIALTLNTGELFAAGKKFILNPITDKSAYMTSRATAMANIAVQDDIASMLQVAVAATPTTPATSGQASTGSQRSPGAIRTST